MTPKQRLAKNGLFFLALVYYLFGYLFLNDLTVGLKIGGNRVFRLDLPFERHLPFWPALIFAYLLEFAFLGLAYLSVDDLRFFKKIIQAFFLCVTIHFLVFLAFPVEYAFRPDVDPNQGWAYGLVDFYYWIDRPFNCFPSLHVSNVFLVSFFMQKFRPGLGWVLHPLAVLVAVSVVLVKQHYVADVAAGFFVGWFVYRQVFEV